MTFLNFLITGMIAAASINGVNASNCRPSSQTTFVTSSKITTLSDTFSTGISLATSTVLTTSGLDVTTDLTTFLTLTADTTTSELASTSTAFVPAHLFPCNKDADCVAYAQLCDTVRCGCLQGGCVVITTTATSETATATSEISTETTNAGSTTADETTTTAAADKVTTTTTSAAVEETTTTAPATTTTTAPAFGTCNKDSDCADFTYGVFSCTDEDVYCHCVNHDCQIFVDGG